MPTNKVIYGDQTIMDITDTSATPEGVVEGQVFYAANGTRSIGTLTDATQDAHGLMSAEDKTVLDNITPEAVNLFDKSKATLGYWLNLQDTPLVFEDFFYSDYIKVEPGKKYKFYTNGPQSYTSNWHYCTYDADKNFIANKSKSWSYTATTDVSYIRFSDNKQILDGLMLIETNTNPANWFPEENYKQNSVITQSPDSIKNIVFKNSKNLFNIDNILMNYTMVANDNNLYVSNGKYVSHAIPVEENTTYYIGPDTVDVLTFYNTSGAIVSSLSDKHGQFTTPAGTTSLRFSQTLADAHNAPGRMFVIKGTQIDRFEDYNLYGVNHKNHERLYNLADAVWHWANGDKFPIGFMGDSTCEGAGTSGWSSSTSHQTVDEDAGTYGSVDYVLSTSFPSILQQMIRDEFGVSNARIYNMAYSGTTYDWIIPKLEQLVSGVYSDVKMVGLMYGINDRNLYYGMSYWLYQYYRNNVIYVINFLRDRGIQPFFVTTQALIAPYTASNLTQFQLRTAYHAETVVNRIMRELAEEYNIEIIDLNKFGAYLLQYSDYTAAEIIPDKLHFNDLGTKLEAQYLFTQITKRCITVDAPRLLTFTDQYIKSQVFEDRLSVYSGDKPFKMMVNYTRDTAAESTMMDFWIDNRTKGKLKLIGYCNAVDAQHVIVDDVDTTVTTTQQEFGTLDVGIHHIIVKSGDSTLWDWIGFELVANINTNLTPESLRTDINLKANEADLADVATSGSYTDLLNRPTVIKGTGSNAVLIGQTTASRASNTSSVAEGSSTSSGSRSHAEGWATTASATGAHSEGYFAKATGSYSHAENGMYSIGTMYLTGAANATTYTYSTSSGYTPTSIDEKTAEGKVLDYNNTIYNVSAIDIANNTITVTSTLNKTTAFDNTAVNYRGIPLAKGTISHAEQTGNAYGAGSHAEGGYSYANGTYSHAECYWSEATGNYSHAEGNQSQASGLGSHAEGNKTTASGDHAHAEGRLSSARGNNAHAEGLQTYASKDCSHSEGNLTAARGYASHSEGYATQTDGSLAHAGGRSSQAMGEGSFAHGAGARADIDYMTALGTYNIASQNYPNWEKDTAYVIGDRVTKSSSLSIHGLVGYECIVANNDSTWNSEHWQLLATNGDTLFVIGNGTSTTNRSNAMSISQDGNETLAGNLIINGNSITIGSTTITESQLQALLAMLNT